MKGKLIVIEGGDGSGKQTQSELLYEALKGEGFKVKLISFPNYNSKSSSLVKMYLNGDFGCEPDKVNVYASSMFYSVDRFASYNTNWKDFYNNGGIVIADRYTTANMIHQGAKFRDLDKKEEYLDWLCDLEYNLLALPKPDVVLFLDVLPSVSLELRDERINKFTNNKDKDIHENNRSYMENSYNNSLFISDKYKWIRIKCCDGKDILSINSIHNKIRSSVKI